MKNNCKDCNYKENAMTGHCYMFKHEPQGICGQFRAKPGASHYRPTVSDDTPMRVSDTFTAQSVINSTNYYETNDSSSSYSGGGGESGGGGASGDY